MDYVQGLTLWVRELFCKQMCCLSVVQTPRCGPQHLAQPKISALVWVYLEELLLRKPPLDKALNYSIQLTILVDGRLKLAKRRFKFTIGRGI